MPGLTRLAAPLALLLLAGDGRAADSTGPGFDTGGDAKRGEALIRKHGCGGCHEIPGIAGAQGMVGPPLTRFGRRVFVAGMLRNTPDGLVTWLRDPQAVVPGNAMPNVGLSEQEARDVATYLQSLR